MAFFVTLFLAFLGWPGQAQIKIQYVVSAASLETGIPTKLALAAVICSGLEGIDRTKVAESYPLPFQIAGVGLQLNGAAAPILQIEPLDSGQQAVYFQVPREVKFTDDGNVRVTLHQHGKSDVSVQKQRIPAPDIFRLPGGSGQGLFHHASDKSLVTEENPARAGEQILGYVTNILWNRPEVETGAAAPEPALTIEVAGNPFPDRYAAIFSRTDYTGDSQEAVVALTMLPGSAGVFEARIFMPSRIVRRTGQPSAAVQVIRRPCFLLFGSRCINTTISYDSVRY